MIYIILINFNSCQLTLECIKSIRKNTYKDYKIIIVDNASIDDSVTVLKQMCQDCIIIESNYNGGFACGCNLGIKKALEDDAEYVLLLNNDTVVEESFLFELIQPFYQDNQVGMTGGRIYVYDSNKIWYGGGKFNNLMFKAKHFKDERIKTITEVEFITGCMQLIKTDVIKQVGLIKEDFFLYYEDAEYCERIRTAGYKLIYTPRASIYHKCGGSASYVSPASIYYSNRSRYMYIKQHDNTIIPMLFFRTELLIKKILYKKEKREAILNVYKYIRTSIKNQ